MSEKTPRADVLKAGETAGRIQKGNVVSRAVRAVLDSSYNTYFMPRM
ncbi:MAG: hypothetical protein HXX10_00985 [Rhodoplanes sp.]|nr:hypothetical protein [Rhodoplanes sp.]NVO12588.1 hypothetical protein [Rhodoplanes sp.]